MKQTAIIIVFFLAAVSAVFAQPGKDKVIKVHGKKCYLHIVLKTETVYGISRDFNVAVKDIVLENPKAIDGISPGDTLYIPLFIPGPVPPANVVSQVEDTAKNGPYVYHKVAPKETLYSITREYKVSMAVLDSLNPGLKIEGLKAGKILRIPNKNGGTNNAETNKGDTTKQKQAFRGLVGQLSNDSIPAKPQGRLLNRYNIALMLTFSPEELDSVRMNRLLNGTQEFPLLAGITADFYDGILMGLDSLAKQGFKANLHVYNIPMDTGTVHSMDSILKLPGMDSMNLIIGPPYPSLFQHVARYALQQHTPLVSPLSGEISVIKNNPYVSKVVPSAVTETEQTADYIAAHHRKDNIIIIHNTLTANDIFFDIMKKRLNTVLSIADSSADSAKVVTYSDDLDGLGRVISESKYNIIIVPYQDAAFVTKLVNQLANSKYTRNDSICVYGMHSWENMDVLDPNNLDTLHLHYPSNEYINYSDSTVSAFIQKYRNTYYAEPDYYSYQGFDMVYFFGNVLKKYGTGLLDNLAGEKYKGIQTSFDFYRPDPNGGLENKGIYMLKYEGYKLVKDSR